MGWWSAYFFAKLLLYVGGYLNFDPWWNLLFAVFTALPARNDRQRLTKNSIASAVSVVLLYHDSWLPPLGRVLSQAGNLADFTLPYLMELLGRFVSLKVLLELAVMLAVYALLKRKLRMSTLVFVSILSVVIAPAFTQIKAKTTMDSSTGTVRTGKQDLRTLSGESLNHQVAQFYSAEQQRQVRFSKPAQDGMPYDIVILHVCSLSWDDLRTVQQLNDPLFKRFDVTFTNFNSAASYSGPAAIRLLRGNCGQTPHNQLYDAVDRACLVMDGLQDAGFEPQWLMNHDGHFGNFFADVHERGGMPVQLEDSSGATVAQRSFDNTPVYDDYSVLSRWWQKRLANASPRVALYYNTISLHDGNRVEGKSLSASSYATRLTLFGNNIEHFLEDLQRSQRHVLVVFIPEHGAAVHGDRRQIQGLREIPTPAITHVPVGVVLINAAKPTNAAPASIDSPSSYLAVNELLSRFIADNPFAKSSLSLSSYLRGLPQTDSYAENEGTLVVQQGDQAMMRTPDGAWSAWDSAT